MLTYILNLKSKIPLYEQLYSFIKTDIEKGRIAPDERLPSKRALANHLKISIITIENAYEQLIAEGYIYSLPRKGFFATHIDRTYIPQATNPVTELKPVKKEKIKYQFSTSSTQADYFPFSTWSKLLREVLRDNDKDLLNKSDNKGIYELRLEIALFLQKFRNIKVNPSQIIVGAGSEYIMNILIQLIGVDKVYGVENPGYEKIPKILEANGIKPRYIPLDEWGLRVDELGNTDVIHVTPAHQFPLGIVMPIKRRIELLQWAVKNNAYIIEDDYDSEFRYTGKPMSALYSLDKGNRVIYINTFTKNLAPALRISYVVLPVELLKKYEEKFTFYSNTVSCFEQYTLAKFIEKNHYERYINKMRLIYKERLDTVTAFVKASELKDFVQVTGDRVGLHILLKLKKHSEADFIDRAKKCGINLRGVSEFYKGENYGYPAVILGFSGISKENIPEALQKLSEML